MREKREFDKDECAYYNVIRGDEMDPILTVRIPDGLRRELKKISKEESIPVSDLVRESLKKYLVVHKFRRLRSKVLPFAESQGILTDEDIFDLIS